MSQPGTGATDKQVNYAMGLLRKHGYSIRYMDKTFAALGATMRQRSGKVEDWLAGMSRAEIGKLIDSLK